MRRNKKIMRLVILIALILLMFLAGYTFARYYKTVNAGKATASVARWSFGAGNTASTLSLSDKKIAPGTSGNFTIEIDATNSEVGVDYGVNFLKEKNLPQNLKFKADIFDVSKKIGDTPEVNSLEELEPLISGNIPVNKGNQKRTITVYWNWDFNENDTSSVDNDAGTLVLDGNGNPVKDSDGDTSLDCTFDIEIIGKQQKV